MEVNVFNLCRVCASEGYYDIYSRIPPFLHAEGTELRKYKKSISTMIADVTGLSVVKNDGLPEKICALCISYLKHAVNFRERVCITRLNLISIYLSDSEKAQQQAIEEEKKEETTVVKLEKCEEEEEEEEMKSQSDSDEIDDNEEEENSLNRLNETNPEFNRFFNYQEKPFVEDDISQLDVFDGSNLVISNPEKFHERKCGFCGKKFMLEVNFDKHLDDCIFRSLIEFLTESQQFLRLREQTAISNHEFIRRIIFGIRRLNKLLVGLYNGPVSTSEPLPKTPSIDFSLNQSMSSPILKPISQAIVPKITDHSNSPTTSESSSDNNGHFHIKGKVNLQLNFNSKCIQKKARDKIDKTFRGVKCNKCNKYFPTITHLDKHKIDKHKFNVSN